MKRFSLCCWGAVGLSGAGCALGSIPEVAELPAPTSPIPHRDASSFPGDDDSAVALPGPGAPEDASAKPEGGAQDAATVAVPEAGQPVTCTFVGQLVSFDLTKNSAGQATVAATAKGPSIDAAPLTLTGVTAVATSGAMNASNWPTGPVDAGKFYAFRVTPPPGCRITATALTIDLKGSNTGPSMAAVGTNVDGYAALQPLVVSTAGGPATVPLIGVHQVTGGIEVHLFGFGAGSTAGTLRVQNILSVTGSLGPI